MGTGEIYKKIKIALIVSIIFLLLVLISTFLTIRTSIKELKNETIILNVVNNLEDLKTDIEQLDKVKNFYLKTGDKDDLKQYDIVLKKIQVKKNTLLNYSIEHAFKKDKILLLTNAVNINISNSNKIISIKNQGGNNTADSKIYFEDKVMIDSVLLVSKNLEKECISILKVTSGHTENFTYSLLWLFLIITLLFFGSLALIYLYISEAFKKLKKANTILLYNSTVLKNIYDAIITTDINFIITDWNEYAEKLYGYTEAEALGKSIKLLLDEEETEIKNKNDNFLNCNTWKGEMLHHDKNGNKIDRKSVV